MVKAHAGMGVPVGLDADADAAIFFADTQVDAIDDELCCAVGAEAPQELEKYTGVDSAAAAAAAHGPLRCEDDARKPVAKDTALPDDDAGFPERKLESTSPVLEKQDANLDALLDEQVSLLLQDAQNGLRPRNLPGELESRCQLTTDTQETQRDGVADSVEGDLHSSAPPFSSQQEEQPGGQDQAATTCVSALVAPDDAARAASSEVPVEAHAQAQQASFSLQTLLDGASSLVSPSEHSPDQDTTAAPPEQTAASFSRILDLPNLFTMEADWNETAACNGEQWCDGSACSSKECLQWGAARSFADDDASSTSLESPSREQDGRAPQIECGPQPTPAPASQAEGDAEASTFDTCDLHFDSQMSQVAGADANGYCGRFALKALLAQNGSSFKPGCSHKRVRLY